MAGFGKVSFLGEYYNQQIVNVFHYRSNDWLPLAGNPFDDVLAFVDAVIAHIKVGFLHAMPSDYTLRTVEGVGFDDAYNIVTASPLIRTVGEPGQIAGATTNGAASCAVLSLRCGPQHSINGNGTSKRNRGYLAVGPVPDGEIDNYSHLTTGQQLRFETIASNASDSLTLLIPPTTLIPIRIHEKWSGILGHRILDWRTYSDVLGWRVNSVASYRKSRQPEA